MNCTFLCPSAHTDTSCWSDDGPIRTPGLRSQLNGKKIQSNGDHRLRNKVQGTFELQITETYPSNSHWHWTAGNDLRQHFYRILRFVCSRVTNNFLITHTRCSRKNTRDFYTSIHWQRRSPHWFSTARRFQLESPSAPRLRSRSFGCYRGWRPFKWFCIYLGKQKVTRAHETGCIVPIYHPSIGNDRCVKQIIHFLSSTSL